MLSQILLPLLIALSPNDRVEMELTGGDTVTGSLSSAQPGVLFIHSAQGHLEVNLELVRSARINDVEISINALHQESEDLWQATSERLTPGPPRLAHFCRGLVNECSGKTGPLIPTWLPTLCSFL
jgi:hypothetical protein